MAPDGGHEAAWFLVSGGSGGIGSATCLELSRRGLKPVVGYCQNEPSARAIAERCGGMPLRLDLSSMESVLAAAVTLERLPRLAGAVLAGSPPLSPVPFGKITADQMLEQWQVNVLGPQRLLAELVRRCFRKSKSGSVVAILSAAMGDDSHPATPGLGAYVIAKFGMAGVLALLAAEYPWLRVRSLRPGYTETPMLEAFDPRFLELQRAKAPFKTAQEVARLIVTEALET